MSKDLRLFSDFWSGLPSSLLDQPGFPGEYRKVLNGTCDFEEFDDRYEIELEVPGVKKQEIEISLQNDLLNISWSRSREKKKGLGKNKRYERSSGSFSRSFHVAGADPEAIEAKLNSGLLKIILAKNEESKAKRISIS
jgi:HSP20 family protein